MIVPPIHPHPGALDNAPRWVHHLTVQNGASVAQELPPGASSSAHSVSISASRAERQTAFHAAILAGHTVAESSRIARVNRATGTRWLKAHRASEAQQKARGIALANKTELGEVLSDLIRSGEVDPRDKVAAVKAHADLMGLNAPTVTRQEIVIGSIDSWLELREREERGLIAASALKPASLPEGDITGVIGHAAIALPPAKDQK